MILVYINWFTIWMQFLFVPLACSDFAHRVGCQLSCSKHKWIAGPTQLLHIGVAIYMTLALGTSTTYPQDYPRTGV